VEKQTKINQCDRIKKNYRLQDRFLPVAGELDWPLFFTIVRRKIAKRKTVEELTQAALLNTYAPAGVLVDQLGNIHYVHGHTGLFLEPAQGYVGVSNILKMVRKKLRRDLNTTLYQAVTSRTAVASQPLSVTRNGETIALIIRVMPLLEKATSGQGEDFYLVIFEQHQEQNCNHNGSPESAGRKIEKLDPSAVSPELMAINNEIESKKMALSQLTSELEETRLELDLSRNKLHSVKATIYESETERQRLDEKVRESRAELEIISAELCDAQDQLEAISETIIPEWLPIVEAQDVITPEWLTEKQNRAVPQESLAKFDRVDQTCADQPARFDQDEIGDFERDTVNQLQAERLPEIDATAMNESENRPDRLELDSFAGDTTSPPVNEKGISFFAENKTKPLFPKTVGLSSENEADPVDTMVTNNELLFKDAADFKAAANHGYRHDNEIRSVSIPEGVEVIRRSMFYKCSQLEQVTVPSTLKAIEDFAFYGCEKLKKIDLTTCKVLEVIGTSAFEGCKSMVGIVIPDAMIEIEEAAFLGCEKMIAVEFQENNQLEILGSHVFKDCQQLKKIILPDQLKQIGISCFYGCENLTEIHLPQELETVGEYAFFGCNALTEIKLPNKKILKQAGFSVGFPEGIKI